MRNVWNEDIYEYLKKLLALDRLLLETPKLFQ